ncbi:MAG: DNA polymerase III subunit alpha [Pseudomonadota bacterium]
MTAAAAPAFVHLRVHSEYSLADGLMKPKALAARASGAGMPALALTDRGNLFGLIKFYGAARGSGVKPIAGVDFAFRCGDDVAEVTLLAATDAGYLTLKRLVSELYVGVEDRGHISVEAIMAAADGLICLSGAQRGDIGLALAGDDIALAQCRLDAWRKAFDDRFFIELQRLGKPGEEAYIDGAVELAARTGTPVVATNPVCFPARDDFEAHETRVCIQQGRALNDPRRERGYTEEQYLKSPAEMVELFADLPSALTNSVEIARRCNLTIELGNYQLPNYPVPDGMTLESFLQLEVERGLEERLVVVRRQRADEWCAELEAEYLERMRFELNVINQMGFAGYFLIVMEFIQWAKDQEIPVGPGRGSGAGSLVAWALKITDLDPIAGKLLFERFLNPERVSMPDFDIDFCMEGRDRVIAHVSELYGKDAVSQIATFGTMAAKAVVRDVARVQGKPYGLADKLSKLIPFEVGMTLEKAMDQSEELVDFVKSSDEVGEIMDMAYKLEGVVRNVGRHAGGVVIAPTKLTDFTPLYVDESSAGLVSQFDKDDVESAGLVKFDFLGLKTLTIIDWAVAAVNAGRGADEPPLRIEDLPLDDAAAFELLKNAETTAVFQLESRGMKDLIRKLLPDSMNDIIALVAIYRPGPMQTGADQDYINRKHRREPVAFPHDSLDEVLSETYGVVLYQEQVMQIAQVLAGFSLGQADLLRRAMGKKKPEEMARVRQQFLEGTSQRDDIEQSLAEQIFDLMEKFAGYAFNKSHSATYALVSYQTAYLKANHPAEFMAANLSADMQHTDKVVTLIDEVRRMGLSFVPPSVNDSAYRFSVVDDRIVYGLGAIKGVGQGPVDAIVAERASGAFVDLQDFCCRVDAKKANKRVLEALIRSGAMDCFAGDDAPEEVDAIRARLLLELKDAMQGAEQQARDREAGIVDLFGEIEADSSRMDIEPLAKRERLEGERDTLGLYLTGHPIDDYLDEVRRFCPRPIADLTVGRGAQLVVGMVVGLRTMRSRRGDTMGFAVLDDRSARLELSLFSDVYEQNKHKVFKDALIVVQGDVQGDEYSGELKVRVREVFTIEEARARFARCLEVRLGVEAENGQTSALADRLRGVLEAHRGDGSSAIDVRLRYRSASACGELTLSREWRMRPSDELLHCLRREFGPDRAGYRYEA